MDKIIRHKDGTASIEIDDPKYIQAFRDLVNYLNDNDEIIIENTEE